MNTSAVFAKLPRDIKADIIDIVCNNDENHKKIIDELNFKIESWDFQVRFGGNKRKLEYKGKRVYQSFINMSLYEKPYLSKS
jgi:hypothetical protein|tara:strand:- start:1107 stop:1352 length:246 start_codon:yes stop_codon:yes gene_type:complete